jgi:hypothetical protein
MSCGRPLARWFLIEKCTERSQCAKHTRRVIGAGFHENVDNLRRSYVTVKSHGVATDDDECCACICEFYEHIPKVGGSSIMGVRAARAEWGVLRADSW